ncbi:hypothetical protein [Selenomonas sp.]|uniref:hypothetical protein n=1 Tax=Selenomonas sp. TaxID=2053611 RepID=UPI0025EDD59F|nr:hypothetical protein [Selenomonas sp.]MCI6284278.1 hypothetical protein [Selenomonas sp.]
MNLDVLNRNPFFYDYPEGRDEEKERTVRQILELLDGVNRFTAECILRDAIQYLDNLCFIDMKNEVLERKKPEKKPDPWLTPAVPEPKKSFYGEDRGCGQGKMTLCRPFMGRLFC